MVRPEAGSQTVAACSMPLGVLRSMTQLWSYPPPLRSCSFSAPMRSPMACGSRKSNGVPYTGAIWPVGISTESTGVVWLALIVITLSSTVPLPSPLRLKNGWFDMFTTVGLSVVAL